MERANINKTQEQEPATPAQADTAVPMEENEQLVTLRMSKKGVENLLNAIGQGGYISFGSEANRAKIISPDKKSWMQRNGGTEGLRIAPHKPLLGV